MVIHLYDLMSWLVNGRIFLKILHGLNRNYVLKKLPAKKLATLEIINGASRPNLPKVWVCNLPYQGRNDIKT